MLLCAQLDLSNNRLCGVWLEYGSQMGTYTAEGITALADALRVNGSLTTVCTLGYELATQSRHLLFFQCLHSLTH